MRKQVERFYIWNPYIRKADLLIDFVPDGFPFFVIAFDYCRFGMVEEGANQKTLEAMKKNGGSSFEGYAAVVTFAAFTAVTGHLTDQVF